MNSLDKTEDRPVRILVHGLNDNTIYSNGDLVKGTVKVDTRFKPKWISITFEGRGNYRIRQHTNTGNKVYHAKSTFFRFSETIHEDGTGSISSYMDPFVSFPFQFRFPRVVQGNVEYGSNLKPDIDFEHEPGHPLPPSMNTEVKGHFQAIQYYLEARMTHTSNKVFINTKTDKKNITFIPSCADPTPATSPTFTSRTASLTRQPSRLEPSHAHAHHGLRSHLKELFPSSSDPSATFSVTTHAPDTARTGAPLHVTFGVAHESRSPDIADPPPLHLRGFHVALEALTRARVPYGGFSSTGLSALGDHSITVARRHWGPEGNGGEGEEEKEEKEKSPPLLSTDGEDVVVAMLTETGQLAVGKMVVPTFKTYGLSRRYLLKVVLWIECAGKTFEVGRAAKFPLTVLPWPELRFGESASAGEVEHQGDGAPPPSYEETMTGVDTFSDANDLQT